MRRYFIPLLLLTAAAFTVLSGCQHNAQAARREVDPVPVQVRAPALIERQTCVSASGTVEGSETAEIAFQVSGRVTRVYVEEGQQVVKGQLLAELDPTDYRNAFDAAKAQNLAAEALAAKADAGLRQQEVEQARIDLNRQEDEYKRMRFLVERKSLPENDFQKVEAAYRTAKERYQMAVQGTRIEDKNAALAQALASKAQAREESKRLADTRLLAPISGTVSVRKVDPGQSVGAGAPVVTIVNLNPVKVRVGVPEADIERVKRGATVEISAPSLPGRSFEGKVDIIGVAADPASRTYAVKVLVPNPGPILLSGMVAEARILTSVRERALTIPGEAVVRDPQGVANVYVHYPNGSRVYRRRIEVGPPLGNEIEVRSGVTGQERIVIAGQQKLRDGMTVRIEGGAK